MAQATQAAVLAGNGLAPIAGPGSLAQMVPIPVRATDADALRRHLYEQHHIEVPVTQHGSHTFVRLSVQAYNTQAELDALVSALRRLGV